MSEYEHLLEVNDLHVSFFTPAGEVKAVGGITYTLDEDEVMGIVGESGSGKSVEAYSIMGLLQSPGKVIGGSITFEGEDVLAKDKKEMTAFRGSRAAMIFQNPMTSLNPVYTIGNQLIEALRAHDRSIPKEEAAKRAMDMLTLVGINNVQQRMKQYPHELSGGMRQRVMIAMGLICHPKLLIADEPTTALDVTIQAQILELMKSLQAKTHMGIIFITHNLGVVAEICDKVSVMYAGKMVEQGPVDDIFYSPARKVLKRSARAIWAPITTMASGVFSSPRNPTVLYTGPGSRSRRRKRGSPTVTAMTPGLRNSFFTEKARRPPMSITPWVQEKRLKTTMEMTAKISASSPSTARTRGRPMKPVLP